MERYKVIVIKKYVFDLDGKDKKGVMEQLDYIVNETKLLDMPYVKKDLKVKTYENMLIYSVKEVAKILHTSPNYVYSLIEKGYLPAIKLGSVKVLKTSLENFLKENEGKDFSNLSNVDNLDLSIKIK